VLGASSLNDRKLRHAAGKLAVGRTLLHSSVPFATLVLAQTTIHHFMPFRSLSGDRKIAEFVLPIILAVMAVYFFVTWISEDSSVFLGAFFITLFFLIILFLLTYSRAPQIAKRVTSYIIGALAITFFLTGYSFYRYNHSVVHDGDLRSNLGRIESHVQVIDAFFDQRRRWVDHLLSRLAVTERRDYVPELTAFYNHHSDAFASVYVLNETGISQLGVPVNTNYLEKLNLKTITKPAFLDPALSFSLGGNLETRLSAVKLLAPFFGADSVRLFLMANVKTDEINDYIASIPPTLRLHLLREGEVLTSNAGSSHSQLIKNYPDVGHVEDPTSQRFLTRSQLKSIGWQVVTVQYRNDAFPSVMEADSELTRILLFSGIIGILAGLILAWYLTKSILSPVSRLHLDAGAIAGGDLERPIQLPDAHVSDEIAGLSHAVKSMVGSLKEKMKLLSETNAKLVVTQNELDAQLDAAGKIQRGFLPKDPLMTSGYELIGQLHLAHKVGGDYFDYFEIDDHHVGILIIDAAGKGISASFYAALIKGITEFHLKSGAFDGAALGPFFANVENQVLSVRDHRTRTVAMQFAILDTSTGHVRLINAGVENPLLIRNRAIEVLDIRGRAMGMPQWLGGFQEVEFDLDADDVLVFHTDGIPDLEETILTRGLHEKNIADLTVEEFAADFSSCCVPRDLHDDVALVLVRVHPVDRQFTKISSIPDAETPMVDHIVRKMQGFGFTDDRINDFRISVREALINAIKHGNQYDPDAYVNLSIYGYDKFIEVKIQDEGRGFEPGRLETPDLRKKINGQQKTGGWGFHVIQKLVSDWSLHRNEQGTVLCLRMIE
jgi:anti-sigma regulatory factor (Ser/Thr protein kinase)/HAMP domain-containing protein